MTIRWNLKLTLVIVPQKKIPKLAYIVCVIMDQAWCWILYIYYL